MEYKPNSLEQWRQNFRRLFDPNPAHVVLLDLDGIILHTNSAWNRFAAENGVPAGYDFTGKNYLDLCESSAEENHLAARQAYVGLQQVLRLQQPKFTMVYPCHSPDKQQWFRMWAQPQLPEVPAIVVAHYLTAAPIPEKGLSTAQHLRLDVEASKTIH